MNDSILTITLVGGAQMPKMKQFKPVKKKNAPLTDEQLGDQLTEKMVAQVSSAPRHTNVPTLDALEVITDSLEKNGWGNFGGKTDVRATCRQWAEIIWRDLVYGVGPNQSREKAIKIKEIEMEPAFCEEHDA